MDQSRCVLKQNQRNPELLPTLNLRSLYTLIISRYHNWKVLLVIINQPDWEAPSISETDQRPQIFQQFPPSVRSLWKPTKKPNHPIKGQNLTNSFSTTVDMSFTHHFPPVLSHPRISSQATSDQFPSIPSNLSAQICGPLGWKTVHKSRYMYGKLSEFRLNASLLRSTKTI